MMVSHDEFEENRLRAEAAEAKALREAKELAGKVADMLNGANWQEIDAFIEGMSNQHRTLQQLFTKLTLAWFKHLSNLPEEWYDLRNRHSVLVAKIIRARLEEEWGEAWNHTPLI